MTGFELLVFLTAVLTVGGATAIGKLMDDERAKWRYDWNNVGPFDLDDHSIKQYSGVYVDDAARIITKCSKKPGSLRLNADLECKWSCKIELRSKKQIDASFSVFVNQNETFTHFNFLVRWLILEAQTLVTEVQTKYYDPQDEWKSIIVPILNVVENEIDTELASVFKSAMACTTIHRPWQTPPQISNAVTLSQGGVPVSNPAHQNVVGLLPGGTSLASALAHSSSHSTVTVPSRAYAKITEGQVRTILTELLQREGRLDEPISKLKALRWVGECLTDLAAPTVIESKLRFSDYTDDCDEAELTEELDIRWEIDKFPTGNGSQISCQWTGKFQPSSGDLIRFILDELNRDLLAAGAMAVRYNAVRARVNSNVRTPPSPTIDWFRDLPENNRQPEKPFWPSLQDYNEAVQNPETCFSDAELKCGEVETNVLGLPKVATGAFASVYRLENQKSIYAVRCFNTAMKDQEERYRRTSRFICSDDLPFTVNLYYLDKGILLKGQWFPILKMEWVDGVSIYTYIDENYFHKSVIQELRDRFALMMSELRRAGIAHSDLQHGNIIIRNGNFVLVDYDGMFVPELSGFLSNERGHPNYQHPGREGKHFGPYLDNFSAWVIDSALLCLLRDPSMWTRYAGDGESLMFKRSDFEHPHESQIIGFMLNHSDEMLRDRADFLLSLLRLEVEMIPYLTEPSVSPPMQSEVETKDASGSAPVGNSSNTSSGLPDWMT